MAPRTPVSRAASVPVAASAVQTVDDDRIDASQIPDAATSQSIPAIESRLPRIARCPLPCSLGGAGFNPLGGRRRSLEQTTAQVLLERRPARLATRVVPDLAREGVDLSVEVVQVMKRHRFQRHRQLGTAELVRA